MVNNLKNKELQSSNNNVSNFSNDSNSVSRDSGTSPSLKYTRDALLKLKESLSHNEQ